MNNANQKAKEPLQKLRGTYFKYWVKQVRRDYARRPLCKCCRSKNPDHAAKSEPLVKPEQVVSVGKLRVKQQHMDDPIVQSIINQVKNGGLFGFGQEQRKTEAKKATGESDWEDVEISPITHQGSQEEAEARRKTARSIALRQKNPMRLNYACLPDIEAEETRPSGLKIQSKANIYIDTLQMRENTFQLQNVRKDALQGLPEEGQALMSRQRKLWPTQMQSLIVARGNQVRVYQSFHESEQSLTQDVFERCKALASDRVLGPARVTDGRVCALRLDSFNTIHLLCDSGIYQQYALGAVPPPTGVKLRLDGPTVDTGHVEDKHNVHFDKLAVNEYSASGLIVLYNSSFLLCFKIAELIEQRLGRGAVGSRQIEANFFKIEGQDELKVLQAPAFMPAGCTICNVQVHQVDLVFVLGTCGKIYVLNHTLTRNDKAGLIFTFKIPCVASPPVCFQLIPNSDLSSAEDDKTGVRRSRDKLMEEFLLKKNLKPSGRMVTCQTDAVCLWDFDHDYDQKKHSCRLLSQVIFSKNSQIVDAKYADSILLLQHFERTKFSLLQLGKAKPTNELPQLLQINLLQLPAYEVKEGPDNYDMHTKRLRDGQLVLSFRHLTQKDVIRDLITTVADQRELYKQLICNDMILKPSLACRIFSESLYCLKYAQSAVKLNKEAKQLLGSTWGQYRRMTYEAAHKLHTFNSEAAREEAAVEFNNINGSQPEVDPLMDLIETFKRRLEHNTSPENSPPRRALGCVQESPRLLTTADMDGLMRGAFGFRPQAQTEQETRQIMSLFNEQDEVPMKWKNSIGLEHSASELPDLLDSRADRARLVSEDIFKEIDEQVFAEHSKLIDKIAQPSPILHPIRDKSNSRMQCNKLTRESPQEDKQGLLMFKNLYNNERDDKSFKEDTFKYPDVEQNRVTLSNKQMQKLQQFSNLQIENARQVSLAAEKTTLALKKYNKSFKQQTQQLTNKVKIQIDQNLKVTLAEGAEELREGTLNKAQDHFSTELDQSLAAMKLRLESKILAWQDDHASRQKRQIDTLAEHTRSCIKEELGPVLVQSLERCLQDHVQAQYEGVCRDYAARQHEGSGELCNFLSSCEVVMRGALGLRSMQVETSEERESQQIVA